MKGIVAFIDIVHPVLEQRLSKAEYHCVDYTGVKYDEILHQAENFVGIVIRSRFPIERKFLKHCKQLKWIARSGAGLENIDLNTCQEFGVEVFNSPEGNQQAVAEHCLGMLLALFNKITLADASVKHGHWEREAHRGIELKGKTVGIIGYGYMGSAFAQLLKAFDCKILAYDKYKKIDENGISQCSLKTLQSEAEIISIHLPYAPDTKYFVNAEFIKNVAQPFYLINSSRGKQLDSAALLNALKSKKVLGACIDVHEFESSSFEELQHNEVYNECLQQNNVIFTPHVAGWTQESYFKLSNVLADKILGSH